MAPVDFIARAMQWTGLNPSITGDFIGVATCLAQRRINAGV
jgi:hypothetical protein